MALRRTRVCAIAVFAVLMAMQAVASSRASDESLSQRGQMLRMFDAIPDVEDLHRFYPLAIYMDVEALERIHGFEVPFEKEQDPQRVGEELGRWSAILSRFVVNPIDPPPYVLEEAAIRLAAEVEQASSGVSAVFAIDRALAVGWRVLAEDSYKARQAAFVGYSGGESLTDIDGLDATLHQRGFVRGRLLDRPFWSRTHDQAKADISDLMSRVVAKAKEVSVVSDQLMISPLPGVLVNLFSSNAQQVASLADNLDIRALVQALTDQSRFGGSLLQGWFYKGIVTVEMATLGTIGPYTSEEQRRLFAEQLQNSFVSSLPAYQWFAAAELQDGDEELLVLALTYEDLASAERAAEIVARRFPDHLSVRYKRPLRNVFDFRIGSHVQLAEDSDRAVAVVTLRHDYPARAEIDMTRHGKLAKAIFEDLEWQRLMPLVVNPAN